MQSLKWIEYWDNRRNGLYVKACALKFTDRIPIEDWRGLNRLLESPDEENVNLAELLIEQLEKRDENPGLDKEV